jgi:hypothetical protein
LSLFEVSPRTALFSKMLGYIMRARGVTMVPAFVSTHLFQSLGICRTLSFSSFDTYGSRFPFLV